MVLGIRRNVMDKKIDRQTKEMDNLVYGKKLRYRKGEWNILGIIHGGEEGKQWQAGKNLVRRAHSEIMGTKAKANSRISRMNKVSASDKKKLMDEIKRLK